ncbi:glycolipid 2-alpha-mannosyltransferase [Scheffersomyces coipomensis]|uniref:glycolipid 2-alpha-mannosyltransferase n=1 Tax=Scheffersomyces coipomensis TaxID=1788519 RepID=UPI00315D51C0
MKRSQVNRIVAIAICVFILYSVSYFIPDTSDSVLKQQALNKDPVSMTSSKLDEINNRIQEMKDISKTGPTPQLNLAELQKLKEEEEKKLIIQQSSVKVNQIEASKDQLRKKYKAANPGTKKMKATFVTLARNNELHDLIRAIRQVEDRFNSKFNYDWVFFNDVPFSDEFIKQTSAMTSGETKYGLIPTEHWSYPDFIDKDKAAKARKKMKDDNIIYGDSESYRHMCRFESGFFWQSELLADYDWYWRVEPGIQIYCDIDYDVFQFMEDNNKVYGFTISIHEFLATIPSLWEHTKKFIEENPQYLHPENFLNFISDDNGDSYNLCHFWSNFEIANLNFWRSEAYRKYFDYLDSTGGFFYERWGDAPIHSIAVSLFAPKDQIHYFDDVGYNHGVYHQCPINADFRQEHKCLCNPDQDFTFRGYSCGNKYYDVMGLAKPDNWEKFT